MTTLTLPRRLDQFNELERSVFEILLNLDAPEARPLLQPMEKDPGARPRSLALQKKLGILVRDEEEPVSREQNAHEVKDLPSPIGMRNTTDVERLGSIHLSGDLSMRVPPPAAL